ncbi:MAG: hypothetical protein II942_04625 [Alphaproteobacteria bacterium]|nr:hypothetical protein [Alphaproteobacteria bacterium]
MPLDYKQEIERKLIHLSSFWMVAAVYFLSEGWAIGFFSVAAAFVLVSEYAAYKHPKSLFAKGYNCIFARVLRDKEKKKFFRFSGAPYVLIAALLLVVFCPKIVTMFALSVLFISDSMAALVGKSIGKHRLFGRKTWEGTTAFVLSGLVVAGVFYACCGLSIPLAVVGVLLGCLGDLSNETIHVDDNLSIPLLVALPFLI